MHLSSLIRFAWADINENTAKREQVLNLMMQDKKYLRTLTRITGISRGRDHSAAYSGIYNIDGSIF
jgi:hypothetical protein